MRRFLQICLSLSVAVAVSCGVLADGKPFGADGIDRTDPNFVRASLLIFGPGEQLYSCAGHVAYRLECPQFNLDYVFSYEGESAADQIFKFFSGQLKMGMFCVPTEEFLRLYRETGRGVRQYRLNLSPQAKIRFWKLMDELVAKGPDLPYDYIKRGCAQSSLQTLLAGIAPEPVIVASWPEKFNHSRRELLHSYIADAPWTRLMLHMISGPQADLARNKIAKIITPDDLLTYLQLAKVKGKSIIDPNPVELLPQTLVPSHFPISPMAVSLFLLLLAVVGCFRFTKPIGLTLLAIQTLIGLAETYIVFVSSLPASDWNWLLIPFNPLPLLFLKWRRYWLLPFALIQLAWLGFMVLSPHRLTDPAFYPLVSALIVTCRAFGDRSLRLRHASAWSC